MSLALVLAFLLPILLDTLEKLFDVGCSGEIFCIRSGRKLFFYQKRYRTRNPFVPILAKFSAECAIFGNQNIPPLHCWKVYEPKYIQGLAVLTPLGVSGRREEGD